MEIYYYTQIRFIYYYTQRDRHLVVKAKLLGIMTLTTYVIGAVSLNLLSIIIKKALRSVREIVIVIMLY